MATTDTDTGTGLQPIVIKRDGHVTVITLNRPDRLNAINQQLTQELHDALEQLAGEFPETRVVIITGAGRGFCSGADVGDIAVRMTDPKDRDPGPDVSAGQVP